VEIIWMETVTKRKRRVFDASFKLQVVQMIRRDWASAKFAGI
jgi:transposase-like protein